MRRATTTTLALALLTSACGPQADVTPPITAPPRPDETGLTLAAEGFGEDPYAIGTSWYNYDNRTHAVTPRDEVYVVQRGEDVALLEITSYYDERGESGWLSWRAQEADAAAWGAPRTFTLASNVKQGPTCLGGWPLEPRACEGQDIALIAQTTWRVVPGAGFAVSNPGVYIAGHPSDADAAMRVARVIAPSLEEAALTPDEARALEAAPDSDVNYDHARVGWVHSAPGEPAREDIQYQATASMQLARWHISALDDASITLQVRCQAVALTPAMQQPLPDASQPLRVALPAASDYDGVRVKLCGDDAPTLSDPIAVAPRGPWADSKTFDLLVERINGRVAVRLAPGSVLWNWSRATQLGPDEAIATPPDALWE